jgi:ferrous iron transport protein A
MTLAESPAEVDVRLVNVAVDPASRLRMREVGLCDGALVRVGRSAAFGGRVVAVAGSRIALDAATARSVEVDLVVP